MPIAAPEHGHARPSIAPAWALTLSAPRDRIERALASAIRVLEG